MPLNFVRSMSAQQAGRYIRHDKLAQYCFLSGAPGTKGSRWGCHWQKVAEVGALGIGLSVLVAISGDMFGSATKFHASPGWVSITF